MTKENSQSVASVHPIVMRREYPPSQEFILRQMGLDSLRGLVFNVMRNNGFTPSEIAEIYSLNRHRVAKLRRTSFTALEAKSVANALRELAEFLDQSA